MTSPTIDGFLIGSSVGIRRARALIEIVAPTDQPVLIVGPTGCGKELVAGAIHRLSGRLGPFVPFNVCAIAESMFEDALFGHVRGAYTGSIGSSPGLLLQGDSGTVFFDEIAALNTNAQAKLLRAVETREFRAVGASADVRSDFRLVAASNQDMWQLERLGRFRTDLAHRLNSFVIHLSPLRQRVEDIPELTLAFLREINGESNSALGTDVLRLLQAHDWPGNVRELRNVVRSAVTLGGSTRLRPDEVREVLSWMKPQSVLDPKREMAQRMLLAVLEECRWDVDEAAQQLGIHRATLYRRLKRAGLSKRGLNSNPALGEDSCSTNLFGGSRDLTRTSSLPDIEMPTVRLVSQ